MQPSTRYFVVAIQDKAKAISAVQALLEPEQEIATVTPVEARHLENREMKPGEVRSLGR